MRPFDETWFERIKSINAQVPLRLRTDSYRESKRSFLADPTREPDLSYDRLDDARYAEKQQKLAELSDDIARCETTPQPVKELYRDKIAEKRAQLSLVRSVYDMQRSGSGSAHYAEQFRVCTEQVYGAPRQDVFDHLVLRIQAQLATLPAVAKATPEYKRTIERFGKTVSTSLPSLEHIPGTHEPDEEVLSDADAVKEIFERELARKQLQGWRVDIDQNKVGSITVWPRTRVISVPNSGVLKARQHAKRLTRTKLAGLCAHEMTHVLRAEHGAHSPLLLLSIGLAGYLRGEEGIATYREQQIIGADDYAAPNVYLAIGLAYGLDRGGRMRTFSEVFAVMRDYYSLWHEPDADIDTVTFLTCTKIFCGTAPGLVLTRDIAYREGNIAIHQLLDDRPNAAQWFDIGKFDPANEVHLRALRQLDIVPEW